MMTNVEYKTATENKQELLQHARRMTIRDIKIALRQRGAMHKWAVEAYEQALDEKQRSSKAVEVRGGAQ